MSTRLKTSYFDLESILAISSPSIPLKLIKQILLLKKNMFYSGVIILYHVSFSWHSKRVEVGV